MRRLVFIALAVLFVAVAAENDHAEDFEGDLDIDEIDEMEKNAETSPDKEDESTEEQVDDAEEKTTEQPSEKHEDATEDEEEATKMNKEFPTVTLQSGRKMPMLGLGTYRLGKNTYRIVKEALEIGYRLIDTAKIYDAGRDMSETAIGKAIANSEVPREEIFITTKIMPNYFAMKELRKAVQDSLTSLRTDYIDLLLMHYPDCGEDPTCKATASYVDGWKNMRQLVKEGIVKDIGISNFFTEEVEKLWVEGGQQISVMQNWLDPYFQDSKTRTVTTRTGIQFQAYSVLGAGWLDDGMRRNPILNDRTVKEIATKYQATPAQVVLKWAIARNIAVIPGSNNSTRLHINYNSYKLDIKEEDLQLIDALDGKLKPLIAYGNESGGGQGGIFTLMSNIAGKVKNFFGIGGVSSGEL